MAQSVNLWGATYSDVPAIEVPKSGGGMASFTDVTDTTAAASDVATGKYFYTAAGVRTQGTGSGGGGGSVTQDQDGYIVLPSTGGGSPSATQHTIYFEFTDSTDATINAWYDSSFISDAITATTPTTYGQKAVALAQLDGVTWYEPAPIPLNTQLIDYTKVLNGYVVNGSGQEEVSQWSCCSDYTLIDPSMTFSYIGYQWYSITFFDSSKSYISGINIYQDTDVTISGEYGHGTLTPSKIPPTASYVRISSYPTITPSDPSTTDVISLIRTA